MISRDLFSRLHALLLLVRQSYQWGRMAKASWQLLHRALVEIPGERHSSWVCSLGSESGQVFILMPSNKMPLQTDMVFWGLAHGDVQFQNGGNRFLLWKVTLITKCWHEGTNEFTFKQSREVMLHVPQPAVTTLCMTPGVWLLKYWGERRTEFLP